MIMDVKKFIIIFVLMSLLNIYHTNSLNIIGPHQCQLDDFERSLPETPDKLKNQYLSEHGIGAINYLKLDWAIITSLDDENVAQICRCFGKVYYSKKKGSEATVKPSLTEQKTPPAEEEKPPEGNAESVKNVPIEEGPAPAEEDETSPITDTTPIGFYTNYWYCRKYFYSRWFGKCLAIPVAQCWAEGRVFHLATSVKCYFTRRLRNIYVFELSQEEVKKLEVKKSNGEVTDVIINYPAGDFKFFAPAVDLKQFYVF